MDSFEIMFGLPLDPYSLGRIGPVSLHVWDLFGSFILFWIVLGLSSVFLNIFEIVFGLSLDPYSLPQGGTMGPVSQGPFGPVLFWIVFGWFEF